MMRVLFILAIACTAFLHAAENAEELLAKFRLAQNTDDPELRSTMMVELVREFHAIERYAEAAEAGMDARETVARIEQPGVRERRLAELVDAYLSAKQPLLALELAVEMTDPEVRDPLLTEVGRVLATSLPADQAVAMAAELPTDPLARKVQWEVVSCYAIRGQLAIIWPLVRDLPAGPGRQTLCGQIAMCRNYVKAGEYPHLAALEVKPSAEKARLLFSQVAKADDTAFAELIEQLAKLTRTLEAPADQATALALYAMAMATRNDRDDAAQKAAGEAAELLAALPADQQNPQLLGSVARAVATSRTQNEAVLLLRRAIAAAAEMPRWPHRYQVVDDIEQGIARLPDVSVALQLVTELPEEHRRTALSLLYSRCKTQNDWAAAMNCWLAMPADQRDEIGRYFHQAAAQEDRVLGWRIAARFTNREYGRAHFLEACPRYLSDEEWATAIDIAASIEDTTLLVGIAGRAIRAVRPDIAKTAVARIADPQRRSREVARYELLEVLVAGKGPANAEPGDLARQLTADIEDPGTIVELLLCVWDNAWDRGDEQWMAALVATCPPGHTQEEWQRTVREYRERQRREAVETTLAALKRAIEDKDAARAVAAWRELPDSRSYGIWTIRLGTLLAATDDDEAVSRALPLIAANDWEDQRYLGHLAHTSLRNKRPERARRVIAAMHPGDAQYRAYTAFLQAYENIAGHIDLVRLAREDTPPALQPTALLHAARFAPRTIGRALIDDALTLYRQRQAAGEAVHLASGWLALAAKEQVYPKPLRTALEWTEEPNAHDTLLHALGSIHRPELPGSTLAAVAIAQQIGNEGLALPLLKELAEHCAAAGALDEARRIFALHADRMRREGDDFHRFEAERGASLGEIRAAVEAMSRIADENVRKNAGQQVLRATAEHELTAEEAQLLLECATVVDERQREWALREAAGSQLRLRCYPAVSVLLNGMSGRYREHLARQMGETRQEQPHPDTVTPEILALADTRKRDRRLLALVRDIAGSNDTARTLRLIEEIAAPASRARAEIALARARLEYADVDPELPLAAVHRALETVRTFADPDHEDHKSYGVLLWQCADILTQLGRINEVAQLVEVCEGRTRADIRRLLADHYAANDKADRALEIVAAIEAPASQQACLRSVGEHLATIGHFDAALAIVDRLDHPARRDPVLATVATTAGNYHDIDLTERMLERISDRKLRDQICAGLADHALRHASRMALARRWVDRIEDKSDHQNLVRNLERLEARQP